MTSTIFYLIEGMRILKNSIKLKKNGFYRYGGNADEICRQVIKGCWNGRFFQTSTTNFPQFWTRDFGWCTEALLSLGHREEVKLALSYALDIFSKNGKATTTITPSGRPFDFPDFAVDSLPWLTNSLVLLNDKNLISRYRLFLDKEAKRHYKLSINKKSGLVKTKNFSSIKDFAKRASSCYDNCMVALLSSNLTKLGVPNPFSNHDHKKIIIDNFWNGKYFYDDLNKKKYVASDANIFPFITGLINDSNILDSALSSIMGSGLDRPIPLRYTQKNVPVKFIWQEYFMKGYELDASWTHMGPLFIQLVKRIDRKEAKRYKDHYKQMIEHFGTYPEVLDSAGRPFSSIFYHCDEGMLWAANYLML